MKKGLIVFLILQTLIYSCEEYEASLTVFNNSDKPIDSISIHFAQAKDIINIKDKINSMESKTISFFANKDNSKTSPSETINRFKYFISTNLYSGTWGIVDGYFKDKQNDTIYVFNNGWSKINDSTKVFKQMQE